MESKSDLRINYPQYTGRRYVFAIKDNPHNKPLIAAEAAFIADVMITKPSILKKQFQASLKYQKQKKGYIPLIDLSRKYGVYTGEKKADGSLQLSYRRLTDLSLDELVFAILEKIHAKTGAKNLYYKSGEEYFNIEEKGQRRGTPYAGSIVLTALVKAKADGRRKGKGIRKIEIEGPFETSKILFNNVHSESEDFFYTLTKQGYTKGHLLTTDVQALLLYAKRNPNNIKNFKRLLNENPNLKIFTPIHIMVSQLNTLEKYTIKADYFMKKGKQPELTRLRDDILFDWLFNGTSFFEIGKKITKIPTIVDIKLADKIYNETADLEVVVNNYIFDKSNTFIPKPVRAFFELMHKRLIWDGFKQDCYCLEKRDSENETIVMVYEKGDESIRLLFNKNFPPLVLKRVKNPRFKVTPFRVKEKNNKIHPFSELFMPKLVFDDKTRARTYYQVVIPTEFDIPRELWHDYKIMINKHFKGKGKGLEKQLRMMNVPNKDRILNLIKMS